MAYGQRMVLLFFSIFFVHLCVCACMHHRECVFDVRVSEIANIKLKLVHGLEIWHTRMGIIECGRINSKYIKQEINVTLRANLLRHFDKQKDVQIEFS